MIWSLAREQLRSQRRYVIAAGIVIAFTVGVAVYGAFMTVTVAKSGATVNHVMGNDREWVTSVIVPTEMTADEIAAGADGANADGHDVIVRTEVSATLSNLNTAGWEPIASLYGDVDWTTLLASGTPPNAGEIAVSAHWAEDNGLELGDTVQLDAVPWDLESERAPLGVVLTITGLARSSVTGAGIDINVPTAYVAWDDVPAIQAAAGEAYAASSIGDDGTEGPMILGVTIGGNGEWAWDPALVLVPGWQELFGDSSAQFFAILAAIGVGALLIGIIAMAFALGRAQAQARARWVATARALGVTQRQIGLSTALEAVAVGLIAGIVGFGLGGAATALHLAVVNTKFPSPMLASALPLAVPLLFAALAFGLVLALIVGAVPAFWASRVQPVAAFKPTPDLADVAVSRRVATKSLVIAWFVSLAIVVLGWFFGAPGLLSIVVIVAVLVVAVGGVMLAQEVLRATLPWHARRLARSSRKSVLIAGDSILSRPRQSTAPAFIVALATAGIVATSVPQVAGDAMNVFLYGEVGVDSSLKYTHIVPLIYLGVFAVAGLLCVAVAAATAGLTAREMATREALGVSRDQVRLASAIQYLVAQLHGMVLGLLVGMAVGALLLPTVGVIPWSEFNVWLAPVALLIGVIVGIGATCSVLGAALVAAMAPTSVPLATVESRA